MPMSTAEPGSTWPGARQLGDQGAGEDQQVGRRSGQQLVAHGADGAEGAGDVAAGLGLELRRERATSPWAAPPLRIAELHRLALSPSPR